MLKGFLNFSPTAKTRFSVSVIGGGAVGNAVADFYGEVKVFDKYKQRDSIEQAALADFIFVAVPTPFTPSSSFAKASADRSSPPYQGGEREGGGQDLTEMDDAIAQVAKHVLRPEKQVVIIKSTVLPGTTDSYQAQYPKINFIFNPEFLTERTASEDFARPDKQLVGYTEKSKELAAKALEILPDAPYKKVLPAKSCEMAKYAINSFYAFKVIFGNSIYDFCQALGLDYETVREGLVADPRIIDSHFDVFAGGYRGYRGKCLPKDVKTLAAFAKKRGVDLSFIDVIIAINERLTPSFSPPHEGEVRRGS